VQGGVCAGKMCAGRNVCRGGCMQERVCAGRGECNEGCVQGKACGGEGCVQGRCGQGGYAQGRGGGDTGIAVQCEEGSKVYVCTKMGRSEERHQQMYTHAVATPVQTWHHSLHLCSFLGDHGLRFNS